MILSHKWGDSTMIVSHLSSDKIDIHAKSYNVVFITYSCCAWNILMKIPTIPWHCHCWSWWIRKYCEAYIYCGPIFTNRPQISRCESGVRINCLKSFFFIKSSKHYYLIYTAFIFGNNGLTLAAVTPVTFECDINDLTNSLSWIFSLQHQC